MVESISDESNSFELASIPKELKGKGKLNVDELDDTIEEEEEDEGEDSDIEVEGLLQKGKLESTVQPDLPSTTSRSREGSRSNSIGGNTALGRLWKQMGLVSMTGVERKLLRKEMLTQVSNCFFFIHLSIRIDFTPCIQILPILLLSLLGSQLTGLVLVRLQVSFESKRSPLDFFEN